MTIKEKNDKEKMKDYFALLGLQLKVILDEQLINMLKMEKTLLMLKHHQEMLALFLFKNKALTPKQLKQLEEIIQYSKIHRKI